MAASVPSPGIDSTLYLSAILEYFRCLSGLNELMWELAHRAFEDFRRRLGG